MICGMNYIVRVASRSISKPLRFGFGDKVWKDREESSEKVFISQE